MASSDPDLARLQADPSSEVPAARAIQSGPIDLSSPINLSNIKGQTILITGGASGLGAGFSRKWAEHGANIIIGDLNAALGNKLVAELRRSTNNDNHHFVTLDVTSWISQLEYFEEALRLSPHGGIDVVVASAGISLSKETERLECADHPDYHDILSRGLPSPPPPTFKTIDVNLTGTLYTSHLALAYLPRNPGSVKCSPTASASTEGPPRDRHLILISSIAGLWPLASAGVYSISKHAVTGLFRNLRVTAPLMHGVRVNMLCPYFVRTPILRLDAELILAGAAVAEVAGVVEAATRLIADRTVIGKGLVCGPKTGGDQAVMAGLLAHASQIGESQGLGVWDVYAHDFAQSELATRRILGLTNVIAAANGWKIIGRDVFLAIKKRLWRG